MIIVIEAPFVLALVHIVVGIKSRPQIPRGRELVSFQEDISIEVNIASINQPLDLGRGDLDPLRPLGPFRLPMVNLSRPPLPSNIPYYWPLNYPKYVKDFNLDTHVKVFKVANRANNETYNVKIVNMFNFTLKDIVSDWCNNYMGDYLYCTFAKLQLSS